MAKCSNTHRSKTTSPTARTHLNPIVVPQQCDPVGMAQPGEDLPCEKKKSSRPKLWEGEALGAETTLNQTPGASDLRLTYG